jgi:hypothetical protein
MNRKGSLVGVVLALVIVAAAPSSVLAADVSFAGATLFPPFTSQVEVAIADLGKDGRADLIVASENPGDLSVLSGNGSGGFSTPTSIPTVDHPSAIAVGDFNEDGNPDLAVTDFAGFDPTGTVAVQLGDGSGGFPERHRFTVGNLPNALAARDLNGDDHVDLVVVNEGAHSITVLVGDGTGDFTPLPAVATGDAPITVVLTDFNRDGRLDAATPNADGRTVSVLLGDGTGRLIPAGAFPAGRQPVAIGAGDFNQDGKVDVAVSTFGQSGDEGVAVLLGDGRGGLSAPTLFPAGSTPVSLVVEDFNADRRLDLAVANRTSDNVSLLIGDGAGGFLPPTNFPDGEIRQWITAGDLNHDRLPDLAVAGSSGGVAVLLNTTAVILEPPSKDHCKNGGWRNYPGFKNQGDCVSFVATGGKNPPANSP